MSLINPLVLYGLALAAIPLILHFLLKSRPKKLLFPALRLLQTRRRQTTRRLRLKHFWLLVLRMLLIGLVVLLIARPALPAADYSPNAREFITLTLIALAGGAVYWGVMRVWRKRQLPQHVYSTRRSFLQSGIGSTVVLLWLLLVGWPYQQRIAAEMASPVQEVSENLPVAAVYLFDTSLSMGYRFENQTRLELAREIAGEHLSELPTRSRVSVADTGSNAPVLFQADVASAQTRIDGLELQAVGKPLSERLQAAIRLLEEDRKRILDASDQPETLQRDPFLREIYLFTDLARSAWPVQESSAVRQQLERLDYVSVYVIDVGVEMPQNVAFGEVRLSSQSVTEGGSVIVHSGLGCSGLGGDSRTVEVYLQNERGEFVKRGQQQVELQEGVNVGFEFIVSDLKKPFALGELRLATSDPLEFDNIRYFTVNVHEPPEVLVTAPTRSDVVYWMEALAPELLVRQGKGRYRCTFVAADRWDQTDVENFPVVVVINVSAFSSAGWRKLEQFVDDGGGLMVVLGADRVNPLSYNGKVPQEFLPGELLAHLKFRPPQFLDARDLSQPLWRELDEIGALAEFSAMDVRRYWRVEPTDGATVVAPYTNRRADPAVLERSHGKGRTVMLTTAVDLQGWSDWPLARWTFVAFADQLTRYLTQQHSPRLNYVAGQLVTLPIDRRQAGQRYLLRKPQMQQLPGEIPADSPLITLDSADQLGHFELVPADAFSTFQASFSVNGDPRESDLSRLNNDDLIKLFGEDRFRLSRDLEGLQRIVMAGRLGQEAFPWLLWALIGVFVLEHVAANRFYELEADT